MAPAGIMIEAIAREGYARSAGKGERHGDAKQDLKDRMLRIKKKVVYLLAQYKECDAQLKAIEKVEKQRRKKRHENP